MNSVSFKHTPELSHSHSLSLSLSLSLAGLSVTQMRPHWYMTMMMMMMIAHPGTLAEAWADTCALDTDSMGQDDTPIRPEKAAVYNRPLVWRHPMPPSVTYWISPRLLSVFSGIPPVCRPETRPPIEPPASLHSIPAYNDAYKAYVENPSTELFDSVMSIANKYFEQRSAWEEFILSFV